jgi:NADH-ubiquinone oxidoreductase chain 2
MLLAMAINTPDSYEALYFYLIQYSLSNINMFLILLAINYMYNENKDVEDFRQLVGIFRHNPAITLSLAITLFSLAGIPPLAGFFAKQQVLYSAISNGYFFMAASGIVISVISGFYYLRFIRHMHFYTIKDPNNIFQVMAFRTVSQKYEDIIEESTDFYPKYYTGAIQLGNVHSFLIALITMILVFFMFQPNLILNSIHLMALYIFNF